MQLMQRYINLFNKIYLLSLSNMELKTRTTRISDYKELCDWWSFWRFPSPSLTILPDYGECGLMVVDKENDTNICAGFIYTTNSGICWLEFIVSNPNIKDKDIRKDSIKMLIDECCVLAKEMGFVAVFSSIKNENLLNSYLDCGFEIGTKNTNEIFKNI